MAADLAYNGNNKTIESLLNNAVERIIRLKHPRKIIESYNGDLNDYIVLICNIFAWIDTQLTKEHLSINEYQSFHSIVETLIYENGVYKRLDYNDEYQTLNLIEDLCKTAEKVLLHGGVLQVVKDGIDIIEEIQNHIKNKTQNVFDELDTCYYINGEGSNDYGYKYLIKHMDELATFQCGIIHDENHDEAGLFGGESDEQIGRIKAALTGDGETSEHDKLLICLINVISDYANLFIARTIETNDDGEQTIVYTELANMKKYAFLLHNNRNLSEFYKYCYNADDENDPRINSDIVSEGTIKSSNLKSSYINELVNLDRLINCRHLMYRINAMFVEYNHKNVGNIHKIKAQMLNTFAESANELDLTNDRDNLKQLIVLCKSGNKRANIPDLLQKIYRKAHQFEIITRYTTTYSNSESTALDYKKALHLLKIGISGLIMLIMEGKFVSSQQNSISVEVDGKLISVNFETTFASPFFAAIEHEMKMISFIIDRDFYDMYSTTDFREFVNDLECELNDDFYINNQDKEASYYNNLTVRETFRIANHIVFITLNAINMGQYYIQSSANFQKLCASTFRLSSILTHYLCGGKLLTEGVISNNWDGDRIIINSNPGSTWLHNELKQILLNILSLNDYNITLKKAILFTIVYINHWIKGDFHLELSETELEIHGRDINLLYENDSVYGFLGVRIPTTECIKSTQLETYIEFCKFSSGINTQSGLSYSTENVGEEGFKFNIKLEDELLENTKLNKYAKLYEKLTAFPFKYSKE